MPAHLRPSRNIAGQLLGVIARCINHSGTAFLRTVPTASIAAFASILVPTAAVAQSITITSINGQAVPPADEVFISESLFPVFEVEWQATASATTVSVFLDGAAVFCDGICSGTSGFFQVDHPAGGCRHTIQIRGTFVPGGNRNSQVLGFWSTPYRICTGPQDCNKSTVGRPIDVATGKMYHEMTDLLIRGPLPIELVRRYDSQSTFNGPLGFGWRHNYLAKLEFPTAGQTVFVDHQGRRVFFAKRQDGTWDENRIEHLVLTQPGTPPWRVTDKHQRKFEFDSTGTLTRVADRNNNQLTFGYTAGTLTTITDSFGRAVTLSYVGGRISTLSAGSRTVTYTYIGDDLTQVDLPDDSSFTYDYEPGGTHNLATVRDALSHVVEDHEYDGSDRVTHFEQDGGVNALTISYDSATQTTVTNSRSVPTVYTHDAFSGLVTASNGPGCASCGTGGASTTLTYDRFLNLTEIVDDRGIHTQMTYDGKGNILTRKEAVGVAGIERTWTFTYHPTFNLLATSRIPSVGTCGNPDKIVTNTYDPNTGDLLTRPVSGCNDTTPFAFTTTFTYDGHGQVDTTDGPRTDVTDVTTNEYYADADTDPARRGRLMRTTNALGHQVTFNGYDLFGNVGSIFDENGVETTFLHDERDRLLERRILGAVPADDIVTVNEYDSAGRLDLIRLPRCVDVGPGCLSSVDYGYDNANRLTEVRDAVGNRIAYAYDTESNRTREEFIDPMSAVHRFTNFAYDSLNRLQYVYFNDIVPEGLGSVFWKFAYDGNGNRTSDRDPEGHVTTYGYDELNRLETATQTVGLDTLTTEYEYDVQDNLRKFTDPRALETSYVNSDMGWKLRITSPDTGQTIQTYDPAGNLINSTDARGVLVTRSYDALDRPLSVMYTDSGLNVTRSYDSLAVSFGIGRRTGTTDPSGSSVFHYDRRGLLTREDKTTGGFTFTTQYEHDKNGNESRILYPTSNPSIRQGEVLFVFDDADRITSATTRVNGAVTGIASGIGYKPFGPVTSVSFANSRVDTRMYDTRYRLTTWSLGGLLSYTHAHNNDDNLTSRLDNMNSANNQAFGYDSIHRLTNASGSWGMGMGCLLLATYEYDRNGNRTCKGEGLSSTSYLYSSTSNRLNSAMGAEATAYSHDASGNIEADGTHTYDFDDAGRLGVVDGGTTATYTYDGDGRRAIKTAAGSTTYYFHDPRGKLLTETVPITESGKDYLYLGEMPLARVDWTPQEFNLGGGSVLAVTESGPNVHLDWTAFPAGSNRYAVRRKHIVDFSDKTFDGNVLLATPLDPTRTHDDPVLADANTYFYRIFRRVLNDSLYFYHADHLGTPIAMTDSGGAFAWRAEHLPFGGIHSLPVAAVANNLRFPGQYLDTESGLHQNWFRDYAPMTARYHQADPIGLHGSPNLYAYADNDPLTGIDPDGLKICRCVRRLDTPLSRPFGRVSVAHHAYVQIVPDSAPCTPLGGPAWGFQSTSTVEPEQTPSSPDASCTEVPCVDETQLRKNIVHDIHNPPQYKSCSNPLKGKWNRGNCQGWADDVIERSKQPGCCAP